MSVLSIQSAVAYGHVGNSVAVFALGRLGIEAWPVDTVTFSNHPGHGRWRGRVAAPEDLREIVRGLDDLGVLARCRAMLSGYLGDAALGEVVLETADRVRAAGAVYCLTPVIGNRERGVFVRPGIPEFFRDRALGRADIVVANAFEAALLSGRRIGSRDEARAAARDLRAPGPDIVVVTGLHDGRSGTVETVALDGSAAWRVAVPFVEAPANGAGDLFAALFLGRYLQTGSVRASLQHAASSVQAVLAATAAGDHDELAIIEAQDSLAAPALFPVEEI